MKCADIVVSNKLGLHARAAAKFVSLASEFKSEVTLARDNQQVNAKSIMGVMMLAAECGSTLLLRADGPDAEDALETIATIIANRFGER